MGFYQKHTVICLICMIMLCTTAYTDVYRFEDRRGRVTFTDTPEDKRYVRIVRTWKGWVPHEATSSNYQNFLKNKRKYSLAIADTAKRYKVSEFLLHAVITTESAYDTDAVSRAGAVGLMQLMPGTAKRYGVKNRNNPYQNVDGGARYLRDLLDMFNNDLELALAAYNAGENAVKKYNYRIPPYKETQNYVKKVFKYYQEYRLSSG